MDLSYAKYWLRSSARCTPYGTFAGTAMVGITQEVSSLSLQPCNQHRRSVRLDMNYLAEIAHAVMQIPLIREQMRFFRNNSIYRTPDGYRYAEYAIRDNMRMYHLASIEETSYIAAVLADAEEGATLDELTRKLRAIEDVTQEEAVSFVMDLWHSQLLVPELEPRVTGTEPLAQLITHLESIQCPPDLLTRLKEIKRLLCHPEEGVDFYLGIEDKLKNLSPDIVIPKNTLQVDLFLALKEGHIDRALITSVIRQTGELKALSRPQTNMDLEDFKAKFSARYEEASVPLSIALDADLGIGYAGLRDEMAGGGEFINGLPFAITPGKGPGSSFDHLQQFTLGKYNDWLLQHEEGINIQETELKALEKNTENLRFPASAYLMGSLLKQDGLLDATHFIFDVAGLGGPSGANLLGRFAHGDDTLCGYVKDLLKTEEQEHTDILYAEIAHMPQARIGNVLLRPVLRGYEIPYVGLSGADKTHQITVDDLLVSVRNGEVVLYSKKHDKRVMPRLATAHNFTTGSLPVYKFLCDLQGQGLAHPLVWDWGHLASLKHLPRVTYKNLVIHKASWKIAEQDLIDSPLEILRSRYRIPQRVVYKEGDNELYIDFKQDKGRALFLHYLKRYKTIQIEEFLFTEDNCVVSDSNGAPYTNELIIPLHQEGNGKPWSEPPMSNRADKAVQRVFSPYSEWLYVKIYSGSKTAEHILSSIILPFVEEGIGSRLFERFFFVRYRDEGGGHIRIRFFNTDKDRQLQVYKRLMQVLQPLLDSHTIDKVLLDTYKRELERYTPGLIHQSERLFHTDSLAVLRFLDLLDEADSEQYRLLFALRGIDALLADFGYSLDQKAEFLKGLQRGFFKEFGGQPPLQKQLNERYRKYQKFISDHMDQRRDAENDVVEAAEVFCVRSERNIPIVRGILSTLETSGRPEKLHELLSSYIHMFMNRLFIAQQRRYELVVYHFLDKYYASRLAITKKEKKDAVPAL